MFSIICTGFVFILALNKVFMKKIFLLFVSISVFASCTSIQKELRNGDYDSAFDKALKRVKNNPGKDKYAVWLEAASDKAYTRDMKQIEYWKKKANLLIWLTYIIY